MLPSRSKIVLSANLWRQQAYALPTIGTSFIIGSLSIMQGIYVKHFGLSLTTLATILFISRVFDAISDPLIGYCSDRHYAKTSSRKPFVVGGGILFIISSYYLYAPVDIQTLNMIETESEKLSYQVSSAYFLVWFLAFYFSWTLFEIPHLAWGSELATTSKEQTKIYSLRAAVSWLGILLFYVIPLLPFFDSQEFSPITLYWAVIGMSIVMLPLLFISVVCTPKAVRSDLFPPHNELKGSLGGRALVSEVLANKPLGLFLAAVILYNIATTGMWLTLLFIFADSYLEIGGRFAQSSLIGLFFGFPMMGVWYWLACRWDKKKRLMLRITF